MSILGGATIGRLYYKIEICKSGLFFIRCLITLNIRMYKKEKENNFKYFKINFEFDELINYNI